MKVTRKRLTLKSRSMLDVNVCANGYSPLYLHGVPVREAHHDVDFFQIKGLWGEMQKQHIRSQEKCLPVF